jgi:hypothetical protein
VRRLNLAFLLSIVLFLGLESELKAQLRNHPISDNFRPQERSHPTRLNETDPADGDLSDEEYHRRRLRHEGLRDHRGQLTTEGLSQEVNQALRNFINPPGFMTGGLPTNFQTQQWERENQRIEQEAQHLARLDRQIQRAREQEQRFQEQRTTLPPSSSIVAQADSTDELEAARLEYQRTMENIQERLQRPSGEMNPAELREMMRSMPGMEGVEVGERYEGEWAETVVLATEAFRGKSREQVAHEVKEALQSGPGGEYFPDEHKAYETVAELLQDPAALPELAMIVSDRTVLIRFIVLNVLISVFLWFLKRRQLARGPKFFKRVGLFFMRIGLSLSLRLGLLIWFFHDNLKPAFDIVKRSIF